MAALFLLSWVASPGQASWPQKLTRDGLKNLEAVSYFSIRDIWIGAADPFDEFTRPAEPKYPETLSLKARRAEKDFVERFQLFGGRIWNYRIPLDSPEIDTGDQAIWHGVYTAMWALKYSVTRDKNDLERLRLCMEGLRMHQRAHREPQPRLIRGVREKRDGTLVWEDDASNDSAGGHLLGIYCAWLYGDAAIKKEAVLLASGLADELMAHHDCLIKADGTPTTYGRFLEEDREEPLNLTTCLAILKVASVLSGDPRYERHYQDIEKQYNAWGLVRFTEQDTEYDKHRGAFLLSLLADLETDTLLRQDYVGGLKRIWRLNRKKGNAWIAFWAARHVAVNQEDLDVCKKVLSEFTLEDKGPNIEKINSRRSEELAKKGIRLFSYRGQLVSSQPLPRWQVGTQDFFWQRSMYSVDDWKGARTPSTLYNMADYLAAYWLGRNLKIIQADE